MRKRKIMIIICLIIINIIGSYYYTTLTKNTKELASSDIPHSNDTIKEVQKEPEEKRMSIVMVGDALIHGAVYSDAKDSKGNYDFTPMFTDIAPIISEYDLRYYNQESIIGGGEPSHYPKLNSPDAIGENLSSIGFNLVSLANNHAFDKGEAGLKYSTDFWKKQKNVITAGSYQSFDERDNVAIYTQNNITYAFLSYTIPTNGLSTPSGKEYYVNVYDKELVKKHVETARDNGAEVIIVAMHWGVEYTHIPTQEQKETAQYLSDLGVNLIIGAHPHVIQPMEYIDDTLVIYSLGNFISGQKSLGLEKIIGLLVGTDIVVKDGKVSFDHTSFELLYTYSQDNFKNYKVIPFNKLNNKLLNNYQAINTKYRNIVDPNGLFDGK